jgi:hypothetical protein
MSRFELIDCTSLFFSRIDYIYMSAELARLTIVTRNPRIYPFCVLERRKELDGSAIGRGILLHYEKGLSANEGGGDDTIVIFEVARVGMFGKGYTTSPIQNYVKFRCVDRVRVASIQSTYALSRNGVRFSTQGRTLL